MTDTDNDGSTIRTVLVVDDDERVLAAYQRSFDERRVVAAKDTETALRLAATEAPDLIIVDLRLGVPATGVQSGLDLVRDLRQQSPTVLIALVSGYLSVATAVAATRLGANAILFKPVTASEILRAVSESAGTEESVEAPTLARAEWEHINRVLADADGNVSEAARRLGIFRTSLQRKLKKHAPRR